MGKKVTPIIIGAAVGAVRGFISGGPYGAIVGAAIGAALAGAMVLLTPKPNTGLDGGITETSRNPTAYRRIIYGQRRVGGTVVFLEARSASGGNKNKALDIVIVVAGHEVSFDEMFFGDDKIWDKDDGAGISGVIAEMQDRFETLEFHTGTAGQSASPGLLAHNLNWKTTHKLSSVAYVVMTLFFSAEKFPAGIPNITFVVKGKKLFDPRDSSTAYSSNAALCIYDYLTNDYYGLGAALSEIDTASFITGANLSDESVDLNPSGTESRYECHGVIDANVQYGAVIESLLTSMGARITYTSGMFRLISPEYNAPTLTIDETHARGPIIVQTRRSRRDAFNGVRGVFASAEDSWTEMDYPPIISSTFEQEDGEPIFKDFPLPFTTSSSMAQRLAKVALLQGRSQISAVIPMNLAAMELVPGDTVAVDNARFGWSAKVFEVQGWTFITAADGALGVDIALSETSSALFDWNSSEEQPHIAGIPTTLPDGFSITAPGLTVSEEDRAFSEDVITVMIIDATSSDGFFESVEVEYKLSSESIFRAAGRSTSTRFEVLKVEDGSTYDIRARVISVTGVKSVYTTTSYTVNGGFAAPSDVTGLSASPAGTLTELEWTPIPDLRLSHYIVRHTPRTSLAVWETSTVIVPKVARPASSVTVASRPGTYLVKAVNKTGTQSLNAATILSPVSGTVGLNIVLTLTEHPTFSGNKTNVSVVGPELSLALDSVGSGLPILLEDGTNLLLEDGTNILTEGAGVLFTSGTYEFSSVTDLSAIFTSRVFSNIIFRASGSNAFFDSQVGNFDSAVGLFDDLGASAAPPGIEAWIEMATTRDDPNLSPTWTDWARLGVHEADARGLKFRAKLATDDTEISPLISTLEVTIDMPDRVAGAAGVQSTTAAGGLVVTYSPAFKAVPAIGIAAQDTVQGDFFEFVGPVTTTGFTIRFKNSSGTVVDRLFDWTAKGYGAVLT